jgi:hypothetical protein
MRCVVRREYIFLQDRVGVGRADQDIEGCIREEISLAAPRL